MLAFYLLTVVLLAAAITVIVAAFHQAWTWYASALLVQAPTMVALLLWIRRHPEVGRRPLDIATVVGLIAMLTVMWAAGKGVPVAWHPAWLLMAGAPLCAVLIGEPLAVVVSLPGLLRHAILPPPAVAAQMEAQLALESSPAPEGAAVPDDEVRRTRLELMRGACVLRRLRHYLLAAAVLSCLLVLAAGLSDTRAAAPRKVVGQSLVPLAAGVALAHLVCLPLQAKLLRYRGCLDGA